MDEDQVLSQWHSKNSFKYSRVDSRSSELGIHDTWNEKRAPMDPSRNFVLKVQTSFTSAFGAFVLTLSIPLSRAPLLV